jgi:hypothetical protein
MNTLREAMDASTARIVARKAARTQVSSRRKEVAQTFKYQ